MTDNMRPFFNPPRKPEDGQTHHFFDPDLIDAVNVAIAISRPLLLEGPAGVGKSSLAPGIAAFQRWALMKETVTSRAEAADFKGEFDAVGRLSDATDTQKNAQAPAHYVTPGILWQAFDPWHAAAFLAENGGRRLAVLENEALERGRVVLIDEIDKGDLDFANDLLDVFDEGRFVPPVARMEIKRKREHQLLVVITSNGDRDLSDAFRRRCIPVRIEPPGKEQAVPIARAHIAARPDQTADIDLTDEQLTDLASLETTLGGVGINVAGFVDLVDSAIEYGQAAKDWPRFLELMGRFAAMRRRHDTRAR